MMLVGLFLGWSMDSRNMDIEKEKLTIDFRENATQSDVLPSLSLARMASNRFASSASNPRGTGR